MFHAITRHGILVTVALLILCLLGTMAALRIPVQMIPDLETRTITVETQWPGATPQDIEKEILVEQEEFLRNLPNLERITSVAGTGWAEIELDFPFGVDLNETLIRVNNALTQVSGYRPRFRPMPSCIWRCHPWTAIRATWIWTCCATTSKTPCDRACQRSMASLRWMCAAVLRGRCRCACTRNAWR